eukprot:279914-Prymnesium_polylepis.2
MMQADGRNAATVERWRPPPSAGGPARRGGRASRGGRRQSCGRRDGGADPGWQCASIHDCDIMAQRRDEGVLAVAPSGGWACAAGGERMV